MFNEYGDRKTNYPLCGKLIAMKEIKNDKIQELLTKGVEQIYPSRDFLENLLKSGRKISVYLGIDPTGPALHLGHAIVLAKLRQFQNLGHQVILLVGDLTSTIGDPSGKLSTRKPLTHAEVLENAKLYKRQASSILKFSGPNKVLIKYNSKWLGKLKLEEILNLASRFTVKQMLERDMFEKRMKEEKPIFLHEFLYPLLQGYDSVVLAVDGEVGGNDQTFNMLVGRDLARQILGKEKFVLTLKLLSDSAGKKMGKTEGNTVSLSENSDEMFGKVMSWSDELIIPGFELCTFMPIKKILSLKERMFSGMNPRDIKLLLAEEITSIYHRRKKAAKSKENFVKTFTEKKPENVKEIFAGKGAALIDVLIAEKIVSSKSDFRRLLKGGAVSRFDKLEIIKDPHYLIQENLYLRVGKHRFLNIKIKN